jgi:hypothetical protein
MSLQRNFRVGGVSTTAVVLLLALTPLGMCRIAAAQQVEPEPAETIEEIVVYGHKSLVRLHRDLYKAEDAVFDLFNSLNSDDEFDIHCYKEAPTGSHIKKRVCKTNYLRDLIGEATRESLSSARYGIGESYIHPVQEIKRKDELLRKEMEALMVERPELANAISKASDAKQVYDSERQKRCEGRFLICRK